MDPKQEVPILKPSDVTESIIFKMIWITRSRKSFLTDIWLRDIPQGHPLWFNMFAHVLRKGKYPYFRYYYKNIVLLAPGEHALLDQGTEEARITYALEVEERSGGKTTANWAGLKALEEELKKEYSHYFPTTRGLMIGQKYNLKEVFAIIGMLNERYMESLKNKV